MQIRTDFPHAVRVIEHVWIPMPDGVRLAARIWLPVDAEQHPAPAILEYIPYRKNDATAIRDATRHPYFAGYGYASIRVDMRGSGDSDGILYDEYLQQEQDDAVEVIRWIAEQPWCSGAVGMMGISWGGFNSLQVAARRPPALKAIITVCSTDDRYADDVHYLGGALLASEMLSWASIMLAYNGRPPDPKYVGEGWRSLWLERLAQTPPYIHAWLEHQRRDEFWQHGSVCEDFGAIDCAVYAIGGWADAYTNAVPRLLAGLRTPVKGLIGPWAHLYPHQGIPTPAIGFLQEALRWWDHWLKGIDTGIMAEPSLRAWIQESAPPRPFYADRPGHWVAEPTWPSPQIMPFAYTLDLTHHHLHATQSPNLPLSQSSPPENAADLHSPQTTGLTSGVWCAYGAPGDWPGDQREDDGLSLCCDSAPLEAPQELLGFPEVTLHLSADQPNAVVVVRLCDVAPNGESTLVTWGALNLTHRHSHLELSPVQPGEPMTVTVQLNLVGHHIMAGHRWRLAISSTYWPHIWPSPQAVTLRVFAAGSQLVLPLRPPRPEDAQLPAFGEAEVAPLLAVRNLTAPQRTRTYERDAINGVVERVDTNTGGLVRYPDGLEYEFVQTDIFRIVEGDPLSATICCERKSRVGRGDWRTQVETVSLLTSDATTFRVTNSLDAYEGNVRVFSQRWNFATPRDGV
jgi:hypothetical protein